MAASALVASLVSRTGRAQEVAVGILRNLTFDDVNHAILVAAGALPPLVTLLGSGSKGVQEAAALAL